MSERVNPAQSASESERVDPVISRMYEIVHDLRRLGYRVSADRVQFEAVAVRASAREVDRRVGRL